MSSANLCWKKVNILLQSFSRSLICLLQSTLFFVKHYKPVTSITGLPVVLFFSFFFLLFLKVFSFFDKITSKIFSFLKMCSLFSLFWRICSLFYFMLSFFSLNLETASFFFSFYNLETLKFKNVRASRTSSSFLLIFTIIYVDRVQWLHFSADNLYN